MVAKGSERDKDRMNHNQQRIDEFCGEYKKLCKKYKMVSRGVTQKRLNKDGSQCEIRDVLTLELADDSEAVTATREGQAAVLAQ